jgi:diguanylate cyclase (GGDEF)-like protein
MANVLRRRTLSRLLQAQAALRELSQRCELTGLLNRRGFLEAAERRMDAGSVTLWFLDVDDLKQVNDRHGHDVGDVLLLSVATALTDVFPDAVVARLSGDEFAVVEGEGPQPAVEERRHELWERMAEAAAATGLPVRVSTGTARSRPGQDLSEALSAADAAMYADNAAKRAARAAGVLPQRGPSPLELLRP